MIIKFFGYLKKRNIDFLMVNGYEDILNSNLKNRDYDLLFRKIDFLSIEDIITSFCEQEKFQLVQIYHQGIWAKNIFVADLESNLILNLDIYAELSRRRTIFFHEDLIFNNRRFYNEIPILSPHHEFIYYLVKKLDKNDLEYTSFKYILQLYLKNTALSNQTLNKFFLVNKDLIKHSFETKSMDLLKVNRGKILQEFSNRSKMTLTDFFKNMSRVLKRAFYPTGYCLSFLGPDGSGKSTIIECLNNRELPFRRIDYFHLKPLIRKTDIQSTIVENPHEAEPYSKILSYLKLVVLLFQYGVGWLKNIYFLKIRSSLVIFDRYYDDLLVDNKRYRYGGNIRLALAVRFFFPRPNIYFILTTDASEIYKRKKEVPFDELERQIKEYRSLGDNDRYFNIDVNRSPKEITDSILAILMKKLNERY